MNAIIYYRKFFFSLMCKHIIFSDSANIYTYICIFWFHTINQKTSTMSFSSCAAGGVLKCSGGGIGPPAELVVQVFQEGQLRVQEVGGGRRDVVAPRDVQRPQAAAVLHQQGQGPGRDRSKVVRRRSL